MIFAVSKFCEENFLWARVPSFDTEPRLVLLRYAQIGHRGSHRERMKTALRQFSSFNEEFEVFWSLTWCCWS